MAHPGLTHSDPLWYKDAIIYELHVRAFYDSNGDGNGDFQGLAHKLDYLQDLGVTTLWLLPFYPSPLRDDGYEAATLWVLAGNAPARSFYQAQGWTADGAERVDPERGALEVRYRLLL